MKLLRLAIPLFLQLLVLSVSPYVFAEPGDSCDRTSDCDEGEKCRDGECVPKKRPKPGPGPQPQTQLYCCDAYGRKWCQMPPNAGIEGGVCACPGVPGSGIQCR